MVVVGDTTRAQVKLENGSGQVGDCTAAIEPLKKFLTNYLGGAIDGQDEHGSPGLDLDL